MSKLVQNPTREIVRLHEKIGNAYRTSLMDAIRIGELLTEQKEVLKHGEFIVWVEGTLSFTKQMAHKYMKVYAHREDFKSQPRLTFAEAFRLTPKKKKRAFKPKSEEPLVLDTEGKDIVQEDSGPSLITEDEIFDETGSSVENDFPVYEGETAAQVLEASGISKPVNWKGDHSNEGAPKLEVELRSPEEMKRAALPKEWIDPLHRLLEAGYGGKVKMVIERLLKKFDLY